MVAPATDNFRCRQIIGLSCRSGYSGCSPIACANRSAPTSATTRHSSPGSRDRHALVIHPERSPPATAWTCAIRTSSPKIRAIAPPANDKHATANELDRTGTESAGMGEDWPMGFQQFTLTDRGLVPAGTDIAAVLAEGDERALHAVWSTYYHRRAARDVLDAIDEGDASLGNSPDDAAAAVAMLQEHALITPAHALEANRRLVATLTGDRWQVISDARAGGDSWSAIGSALDLPNTEVREWFTRMTREQAERSQNWREVDRAEIAVRFSGDRLDH